jgi:hypothetical protein
LQSNITDNIIIRTVPCGGYRVVSFASVQVSGSFESLKSGSASLKRFGRFHTENFLLAKFILFTFS